MHDRSVWLNGRIVPGGRARLPVAERGLLYGDGLFETTRVYRGHAFLLPRHLARLRRSARTFGIPVRGSDRYWRAVIRRLLATNHLTDAAVRLTVTRGTAEGLVPSRRPRPTLLVQTRPLEPGLEEAQERGVAACLLPFDRGPEFFATHKTLAYLPAVLGRREAKRQGTHEGLHVTPDGLITEATTANVFVWHRDRLRTPRAGVLPGVTRGLVIDLARALGYRVEEKPLPRSLLHRADEVFLTSSVVEVLPLSRIGSHRVGTGRPGPVSRALQEAYRARVARALRKV
jgi:branched-subunit amino acid aminotransferase/4-amino-4-deoxychorismate lyase